MEVIEAKETNAMKVWRQNNLGKFYPKSHDNNIKDKKQLKNGENKEKSHKNRAPRAHFYAWKSPLSILS